MHMPPYAHLLRTTIAAVALTTFFAGGPALAASAATAPQAVHHADAPSLGLVAVAQTGPYFDAIIAAGATKSFVVDRVNSGNAAVSARTYVGVVGTIVNGGFGAANATAPLSGASTWVDYPQQVLDLAAGEHSAADFTVTVPSDTPAGQYVSSIVLENAVASAGGSGEMTMNRIVRQAVAVSIRVPGAFAPAFSLGAASLGEVAGNTVVSVDTSNTGNQHLAPKGTMTMSDSTGKVISSHPITMGSFYAGMSTQVVVALTGQLPPGDYTMSLTLRDPLTGVQASAQNVALKIAAPDVFEQASQLFAPVTNLAPPGFTPLLIGLIVAGVLGLLVMAALGTRRLGRRLKRRTPAAEPFLP